VPELEHAQAVERQRARSVRAHAWRLDIMRARGSQTATHVRRVPMIKVISLLARKDGMTHEQFMKHWVEIHGPLALKVPGIRRYVQSHIVDARRRPDIPDIGADIDGVAELWYDDRDAFARANATPEMKALLADGVLFIGHIQSFLTEEHIVIA
jgi:uncharacterized protein (TIGR02118 family)